MQGDQVMDAAGASAEVAILQLFGDGGIMMYPLVLCSMVGVGVMLAKFWTLWVAHSRTTDVLQQVEEAAVNGRLDQAEAIAAETRGPAAAILLAGLRRIQRRTVREGELEQAISTTGSIELGFLERGLVILATIANVAPLMGFLGTVAGMILAFAAIESAGSVEPGLVAGGIKVALLTTATGLLIAIPINIGYNYFVTRIDQLILDMEQGAQKVLNIAWDMEKAGTLKITADVPAGVGGSTFPRPDAHARPLDDSATV